MNHDFRTIDGNKASKMTLKFIMLHFKVIHTVCTFFCQDNGQVTKFWLQLGHKVFIFRISSVVFMCIILCSVQLTSIKTFRWHIFTVSENSLLQTKHAMLSIGSIHLVHAPKTTARRL